MAMIILRLLAGGLGVLLVVIALMSAIRTLVVPRAVRDKIARVVFQRIRGLVEMRADRASDYAHKDAILAYSAPLAILTMLFVWLGLVLAGCAMLFFAVGVEPFSRAIVLSGSSLLTLGFERDDRPLAMAITFFEGTVGLILVALLIAYLPAMYSAFQRREALVSLLEVRSGSPPSAVTMLERLQRIGQFDGLGDFWADWERWFAELEESHSSLGALVLFRSPQPDHSWVTASGTVLDTASLWLSAVDRPFDARAALCIRAGYVSLSHIARFLGLPLPEKPTFPEQAISITREDFLATCERLSSSGVPIKDDRDLAWKDFAGWRVNYDIALLSLAAFVRAPEAPWTSDRMAPDVGTPAGADQV